MVTEKTTVTYDVAFRVDGNSRIGMGHTMRCISVADQLKARDVSVIFVTSDRETDGLLSEYGYDRVVLENDYRAKAGETADLLLLLDTLQVKLVFVDSYETDTAYLQPLHERYAVATFGKHTQYANGFDLLIDYNIQYDEAAYKKLQKDGCELLLGAQYTPLRSQFVGAEPAPLRSTVKDVLITTGGSDKYRITDALLAVLSGEQYKDIRFHVIVGHLFGADALKDRHTDRENMILHRNVHDMAALCREMDMAVCAGGTTLYELLAVGVPAVVFSFSDNQNNGLYMSRYVTHCGDIRRGDGVDISAVIDAIDGMLPLQRRIDARGRGSGLIDGNGACRIADRIAALLEGRKNR